MATSLPWLSASVADNVYSPARSCLRFVPIASDLKGWVAPALVEELPAKTVCPLLFAMLMLAVEADGTFRSQVVLELGSAVVLPLTAAVFGTNSSASVACAVC